MTRSLLYKFLAIGVLILLLLIPLAMIGNSIDERRAYSEQVVQDIARSSAYSQTLVGPILVIPYRKKERYWTLNDAKEKVFQERVVEDQLYFLPDRFRLQGVLKGESRQLGIYSARLYHADTTLDGHFSLPVNFGITENLADYTFDTPFVAVGISDIRGIKNSLQLVLNQQTYEFEPGSQLKILGDGVHARLPQQLFSALYNQPQTIPFSFKLMLQGTEQFHVAPVGKETHIELQSDWPHPRFLGDFLPVERSISDTGFNARWQTSYFSTNFSEYFMACTGSDQCEPFLQRRLGVSLLEPINLYVKSDRAIKYALLFIALTFASFFLFEILKRLQVHPVQYALVGLALAFFYLLLLALSEHIAFVVAYTISAFACVLLIGFYVSHVLQSMRRGIGFSAGLGFLYLLLYGLLSAEDYALLMGALLLFAVLGLFMLLTRKVDWYSVGAQKISGRAVQES
uniref:cell envelope integrity protein CreD n=1 Tax=Cellvibrio fontiphilus TaxID=1815559 RepID=UPI002B4BC1C5|nr:cell envelope integrity protein CreD [Cellvibrio fontiphilus]